MKNKSHGGRCLLACISIVIPIFACSCGDDVVMPNDGDGTPTQPGWFPQNVHPTVGILQDVYAIGAQTAVAAGTSGYGGVIVTTTDGGATWTSQEVLHGGETSCVFFLDANRGWVAGDQEMCVGLPWDCTDYHFAVIFATTDGGATWTTQEGYWLGEVSGVFFVDAQTGWAVGSAERDSPSDDLPPYHIDAIFTTTDGGVTWAQQYSGAETTHGLSGVFFVSADMGWVVGGNQILSTKNGGRTWVCREFGSHFLRGVSFADANSGWVVGRDGTILATTDGGVTWAPQSSGTESHLWDVCFVNANTGWVLGSKYGSDYLSDFEVILKTTDGGRTWGPQTWGTEHAVGLSGVSFSDASTGWAVGSETALATTDGGEKWSSKVGRPTTGLLWGVSFVDASRGWAVGDDGYHAAIIATTDGGETWTLQYDGTEINAYLEDVFFLDANMGWAVGIGGRILATVDGGSTWTPQISGTMAHLYGVSFSDAGSGWAVGGDATILATTDGGATWSPQTSGSAIETEFQGVAFVDANAGWVVGTGGTILATTDGGETWTSQESGAWESLVAVCFIDTNTGWVVGDRGKLLATTDGGTTWTSRESGTSALLHAVCFIDANRGWIASWIPGTVYATADGGKTWTLQSGTGTPLMDVSFVDENTGWAVGAGIFKTTTGGRPR